MRRLSAFQLDAAVELHHQHDGEIPAQAHHRGLAQVGPALAMAVSTLKSLLVEPSLHTVRRRFSRRFLQSVPAEELAAVQRYLAGSHEIGRQRISTRAGSADLGYMDSERYITAS